MAHPFNFKNTKQGVGTVGQRLGICLARVLPRTDHGLYSLTIWEAHIVPYSPPEPG